VAFHEVSEHDEAQAGSQSQRPNRRRRQGGEAQAEAQPLQMVETQAPVQMAPEGDDELPRRTKPRRRRAGQAAAEPLQMVETTHEEPHQDNPPQ